MKTKTKPQLRVEIAKDVIDHINAKRITCNIGGYFNPSTKGKWKNKSLQDVLPKLKYCNVCAIGVMFYSYVMRHNNFTIGWVGINGINDNSMREAMSMFSKPQMELIESAFEISDYSSSLKVLPYFKKAVYFREKRGLTKRDGKTNARALELIMKNIIRNKGTFKP